MYLFGVLAFRSFSDKFCKSSLQVYVAKHFVLALDELLSNLTFS